VLTNTDRNDPVARRGGVAMSIAVLLRRFIFFMQFLRLDQTAD